MYRFYFTTKEYHNCVRLYHDYQTLGVTYAIETSLGLSHFEISQAVEVYFRLGIDHHAQDAERFRDRYDSAVFTINNTNITLPVIAQMVVKRHIITFIT